MGWFDGGTDDDAEPVFDLFVAKNTFRIGDYGRGNYYDPNKHRSNIAWKVVKIVAPSRRDYPPR